MYSLFKAFFKQLNMNHDHIINVSKIYWIQYQIQMQFLKSPLLDLYSAV